jgi:hypothetical protein
MTRKEQIGFKPGQELALGYVEPVFPIEQFRLNSGEIPHEELGHLDGMLGIESDNCRTQKSFSKASATAGCGYLRSVWSMISS